MKVNKEKLADSLRSIFSEVEKKRRTKEEEWIEALRQFKGQYPPDILAKIRQYQGSEVYPRYTRSKVKPTISKINQIFFPVTNKSWHLSVDKNQKYPSFVLQEMQQKLQAIPPEELTKDKIKRVVQSVLEDYKTKVENELNEQLKEMKFEEVFKQTNYSAVMFGTGVIKGVLTKEKTRYSIVYKEDGSLIQEEKTEYVPYVEYIPIWYIYPDMSTFDPDKMSFVFQRHKLSRRDLINLADFDGFDKETIMKYISANPDGDYQKPNWEYQLESLSTDNNNPNNESYGLFDVLEYWGFIDGHLLNEEQYDPNKAYMCNAWLLGKHIIKVEMYPSDIPNDIYHFYYYEKDDSSIFGTGLPNILNGTQLTICAAARMIIDNGASVTGPQLEVNVDLLSEGQDISTQYPRKIWFREGRGQEAQYPAIRTISSDSHIQEYATIINIFKQFGDEESNLPAFVWGNPDNLPANTTATGFTQLSSNTNMSIADIVRGYEKENIKILKELIDWNKEYNTKMKKEFSIKYLAEGFGYESQVYKEQMLQSLAQFNSSITPQDEIYINKLNLYKHELRLLGLPYDDILRSEEEVEAILQSQRDAEAEQLAKEQVAADIEYTKAKATHMLAKSKDTLDKSLLGDNK